MIVRPKLSKHFSYSEFFKDGRQVDNDQILDNIFLLTMFGLNRVRKKFGPTIITSGYRSEADQQDLLARGYKPSPTSQHLEGAAVDFICKFANMGEVYRWMKEWWPGQIFYYPDRGHVHIGLPTRSLHRKGRLGSGIRN